MLFERILKCMRRVCNAESDASLTELQGHWVLGLKGLKKKKKAQGEKSFRATVCTRVCWSGCGFLLWPHLTVYPLMRGAQPLWHSSSSWNALCSFLLFHLPGTIPPMQPQFLSTPLFLMVHNSVLSVTLSGRLHNTLLFVAHFLIYNWVLICGISLLPTISLPNLKP